MRKTLLITTILLGASLAQAQVVSPLGGSTSNPQSAPPAAQTPASPGTSSGAGTATSTPQSTAHRGRMTMKQRFEAANTTHDGKLTKEQAQAGHMRSVVRDFDKIDTAKRGYVSYDEVRAYQAKRRAERRAARGQKPAASE